LTIASLRHQPRAVVGCDVVCWLDPAAGTTAKLSKTAPAVSRQIRDRTMRKPLK